jgi:nucleotide sugar dehydrogenase
MKVGVVGCGVVGSAVADGLERVGNSVFRHDPKLNTSTIDLLQTNPDIIFICVPTPSNEDGSCNTDIVISVLYELNRLIRYSNIRPVIAIKSTVSPGTTEKFRSMMNWEFQDICFVPEFLRERSAFSDFVNNHDLLAIGSSNNYTVDMIKRCHGKLPKKVVSMTPTEAELLKYYSNCFNATRITFANVMYEICKACGADYDVVKNAFILRETATDLYMDANDNFRGYSGPCLPKDTNALRALIKEKELPYQLFEAVAADNGKFVATIPSGMRES